MEPSNAVQVITLILSGFSLVGVVFIIFALDGVREALHNLTEGIDGIKNKVTRKTYYNKNRKPNP